MCFPSTDETRLQNQKSLQTPAQMCRLCLPTSRWPGLSRGVLPDPVTAALTTEVVQTRLLRWWRYSQRPKSRGLTLCWCRKLVDVLVVSGS